MANRRTSPISDKDRELFSGELTLPDASKYTILLDTTQQLPSWGSVPGGKSAAVPTVGSTRGLARGKVYSFTIRCTDQNVTLLQYLLDGAGAWSLFATTTITAGAAVQTVTWDPSAYGSGDCLVLVLGGATPPTKIYATLNERWS